MSLHTELLKVVHRLRHLASCHPFDLQGDKEVHFNDAIAEVVAVAEELDDVDDPIDAERPPVRRFLGPVEGVALLRRQMINGTSLLTAPDAGPAVALVVLLDDGGVGWQAPDLGGLNDEQLAAFIGRYSSLLGLAEAEQIKRGGGR